MNELRFYIEYDEIRSLTFAEFGSVLNRCARKPVGDVTICELSSTPNANGLYFMFASGGKLAYIGKASSRSFVERIPSHFDQREDAWMNTVSKKIKAHNRLHTYEQALQDALRLELVLLGFENRKTSIKLEAALRSFLEPSLNPGRKKDIGARRLREFEA